MSVREKKRKIYTRMHGSDCNRERTALSQTDLAVYCENRKPPAKAKG